MNRRWPSLPFVVLLLGAAACSDSTVEYNADDTGGEPQDSGDTADTASGTDDPAATPAAPSWIAVGGSLTVVGGAPNATASTLTIEYRLDPSDEPATSDTGTDAATLPCTRTPTISAITAETPPDPAVAVGWWAFTLDPAADAACPFALPADLHLGVGALDAQLYAAMDLAGMSTTQSALYGLYVRVGDATSPVWVYGVVGTADQYAGTATPVAEPPLPDGTYTLTALHLLPYTPAR